MEKEYKKENSAIDKAEMIANNEYNQVIAPTQGLTSNGGFVQPQVTPI